MGPRAQRAPGAQSEPLGPIRGPWALGVHSEPLGPMRGPWGPWVPFGALCALGPIRGPGAHLALGPIWGPVGPLGPLALWALGPIFPPNHTLAKPYLFTSSISLGCVGCFVCFVGQIVGQWSFSFRIPGPTPS